MMNGEIVAAMSGTEAVVLATVVLVAYALVKRLFRKALETWQ